MKTSLDHLPPLKQRELAQVVDVLRAGLAAKLENATQPHKRNGKILKVILYGSYARGGWVEDHKGGYYSDFDILVIVDHPDFTDVVDYWIPTEQILQNIRTPVQVIYHTLDEVNSALKEGRYFFFYLYHESILLYEYQDGKNGSPKYRLANPTPPDATRAYEIAKEYDELWSENAIASFKGSGFQKSEKHLKRAAFDLHQATEACYVRFLLTHTLYTPKSHDIEKLRTRVEDINHGLRDAWPRGQKPYNRYFDLLKRAYVEARYSKHYEITKEELEWLEGQVSKLIGLVDDACQEHLENLKVQS